VPRTLTNAACRDEERFELTNATLFHALDNLAQGVVIFDAKREVVFCNKRYHEIYGFAPDEVQAGTPVSVLIKRRLALGLKVPADADEYVQGRTTGPIVASQAIHEFADGRVIAYSVQPMPDGGGIATHEDITEREQLHAEIRERNQLFDIALGTMAEGLCIFDSQLNLIACNDQYRNLFDIPTKHARPGISLREIIALNVDRGRHPGMSTDQVFAERMDIVAKGEPATLRARIDGTRTIETTYRPAGDDLWVVTYDDVTEREQFEEALAEQNRRFDAALGNMPHGLSMFDGEGRLIVCNARYAEMYRLPEALTTPGARVEDISAHRVATGQGPADLENYRDQALRRARAGQRHSEKVTFTDGRTLQIDHRPMSGGGWVGIHQDVTEATKAEAQINHLAHHDALTGLPNRMLFKTRLEESLKHVPRGEQVAVLCLDLDHFKAVNDTLGHPIGDKLLEVVARRLTECVRETDTVARLGGDEFAIIVSGGAEPERVTSLASRIIEVIGQSYGIGGHQVMTGTSIGIALAPIDGTTPDELLKHSDLALYRAKADGRGVYRFFEPAMDARMQARRAMELELRKALANDEFRLTYQPLVNLASKQVVCFEALLRWHHPERGVIRPAEFIELTEDIGLIVPIGAWVLKQACRDAASWPSEIKVSVNLSPVQFKNNTLALDVAAALGSSGLPARRLELEITETVMLHDTEATLATLQAIKALGVSISMDDFGTGYSSLSYLRKFPFDKIKIDQSFVRGINDHNESRAIVRAVTSLGRSLGMATVAEGVETLEQLNALDAEGCTEIQGYLFSPPVPVSDIPALLSDLMRERKIA
jgi:diguanylate cyclase (GGDEF)-like protein